MTQLDERPSPDGPLDGNPKALTDFTLTSQRCRPAPRQTVLPSEFRRCEAVLPSFEDELSSESLRLMPLAARPSLLATDDGISDQEAKP
eukprot:CAMPEP_0204127088 /NCGR_PEP_ID=MMETSP0361-20130328/11387_1 /ASSEMBLY_ACC=CAM_ASM_000343 /TAXON_ID=268821 /ORGANISM="Scrippsiella Hangoei, Strain SHTV-5" /LENGTH=88 /DNA_ID=CAMNT_0051079073 /DNA_START=154 /DNA_END=421 /DNA_ORIENTATION=+